MYTLKLIKDSIKALRKEAGLTQQELAQKIKLTNVQIARYETGKAIPSIETLIKLSQFFDVSIDQIVLGVSKDLSKRAKIQDRDILDLLRKINSLKKPQRDKIKWVIESAINNL